MEWLNRFWSKVHKRSDIDCWEWTGYIHPYGYGKLKIRGRHKLAHRLSWIIAYGKIPNNMCICHKCDNRKCVNPNHLFVGTKSDNIKDRHVKGRSVKGESNGRAILTETQVVFIKQGIQNGIKRRQLATMFNVGMNAIDKIACGRTWQYLG